jgi:hypothetical protein
MAFARTLAGYTVAALVVLGGILFTASFVTKTDPWQGIIRPAVVWCADQIN